MSSAPNLDENSSSVISEKIIEPDVKIQSQSTTPNLEEKIIELDVGIQSQSTAPNLDENSSSVEPDSEEKEKVIAGPFGPKGIMKPDLGPEYTKNMSRRDRRKVQKAQNKKNKRKKNGSRNGKKNNQKNGHITKTNNLDLIPEKKICLCMIVKNESKIMLRCLDAVKPILDYICILDTGNPESIGPDGDWDDGATQKLINDWGTKNNVPTKVHNEPFVNFEVSRTRSAELAIESCPGADYLLLIDADMVIEIKDGFDKRKLTLDNYTMKQYSASVEYWNVRLVSTKLQWKSKGVTHEFWEGKHIVDESGSQNQNVTDGKMFYLGIDDREDGGCKSDKFVRDERLLRAGLKDPNESEDMKTRYKFYLGQTLKSLGKYTESIEMYQDRIDSGGWYEEIFYSYYQIARNYHDLHNRYTSIIKTLKTQVVQEEKSVKTLLSLSVQGLKIDFDDSLTNIHSKRSDLLSVMKKTTKKLEFKVNSYHALAGEYYVKAWDYNPKRIDALYEYVKILRGESRQKMALMYALKASNQPFPNDQKIFIDRKVWDYLLDFEIVICAYYTPDKRNEGIKAIQRIRKFAENNHVPQHILDCVNDNEKWYKK